MKIRRKNKLIPISLKDFTFEFLKYSETIHSLNTSKVFKVTLNYLVKFFGNPQLTEITASRLNEYFTDRIKETVYPARKDLINISSAFTYAVKQGYLQKILAIHSNVLRFQKNSHYSLMSYNLIY